MWYGLALTFFSSVFAFVIGVTVGYLIGIFVSSTIVNQNKDNSLYKVGQHIGKLYDMIYVVPLVLTLSLCYATNLYFHFQFGISRQIVALIMIAIAGSTLGGYRVYQSIFKSVYNAKIENRQLIESLFFKKEHKKVLRHRLLCPIFRVRRFRDCEITSFYQSLEDAFHLSIVSIVILETIIPSFYENIFPQTGVVKPWLGGVGRQILTAQQNYEFQIISGCIWAIILFDGIFVNILGILINKLYLKPYKEKL